jgi:transcription elongation factor Elf1
MTNPCHVADSQCLMPANHPNPKRLRTRCVSCGNGVCVACSILTKAKDLPVKGRWCGACLDSRTRVVFDPILVRYWYHQVSLAGYSPGDQSSEDQVNDWIEGRRRELSRRI